MLTVYIRVPLYVRKDNDKAFWPRPPILNGSTPRTRVQRNPTSSMKRYNTPFPFHSPRVAYLCTHKYRERQ